MDIGNYKSISKRKSIVLDDLGPAIRRFRLEKGVSLKSLAEKTGLTKGLLSQIENTKTTPTLKTLFLILSSLEITTTEFFCSIEQKEDPVLLVKKNEKLLVHNNNGIKVWSIAGKGLFENRSPFLMEFDHKSRYLPKLKRGNSFYHVKNGECCINIGKDSYELCSGDSICLNSMLKHEIINRKNEYLKMIGFFMEKQA